MAVVGSFGAARAAALKAARPEPDTFLFCGETFRVADEVGAMPLMRFAAAAASGLDSADMDGLVAMTEMIRDTINPEDWARFQQVATDNKADGELLMEVCQGLYEHISARPTVKPTDSSDGLQTTGSGSSGPASTPPESPAVMVAVPTANGFSASPPGPLATLPMSS
jgi:hypothetical protein